MKRPTLVTSWSLGVLILAAFFLGGFVEALSLPELPLTVPRSYLAVRNLLWGSWALLAAAGAFVGGAWAPRWIRWGGALLIVWYWVDRLLLTSSNYARRSAPAAAVITIVLAGATAWVLRRPQVRSYFGESVNEPPIKP